MTSHGGARQRREAWELALKEVSKIASPQEIDEIGRLASAQNNKGMLKNGEPLYLDSHTLPALIQHAAEEAADLCVYLTAAASHAPNNPDLMRALRLAQRALVALARLSVEGVD